MEAGYLETAREHWKEAYQSFTRALALAEDSVEAVVGQSYALRKMGLLEAAAQALARAPRPDAVPVRVGRGFLALDQGDYDEALQQFNAALEVDNDSEYALAGKNLAGKNTVLRTQGSIREAADLIRSAIARTTGDGSAILQFELGLLAYDEHRYQDALEAFRTTTARDRRTLGRGADQQ